MPLTKGKSMDECSSVIPRLPRQEYRRHNDEAEHLPLSQELHQDAVDPPDLHAAAKLMEMKVAGIAFCRVSHPKTH